MTHPHFCTCFDHRYAAQGLAMWRSLKAHRPDAVLHVLCLDDACHAMLEELRLENVHASRLDSLEAAYPDLATARNDRSLIEYYFTLTPHWPLFLFDRHEAADAVTYVDADLFFFSDPQPVFDEIAHRAIGIVEHRFPEDLAHLEQLYGRFNVGWLTFRRNAEAFDCLRAWRQQCLEWCFDRPEGGRFADQKYLDQWPARFPSLAIVRHAGANVAPWNLNGVHMAEENGRLFLNGQPLLFFHAHGFRPQSPGLPPEPGFERFNCTITPLIRAHIIDRYDDALRSAVEELALPLALAFLRDSRRETESALQRMRQRVSEVETERAAMSDVIEMLEHELSRAESQRDALERSRTWRWTAPLRKLLDFASRTPGRR